MLNNSFISIVTVIENAESDGRLSSYLKDLHTILIESFSDYEIILVNNEVLPVSKAGRALVKDILP